MSGTVTNSIIITATQFPFRAAAVAYCDVESIPKVSAYYADGSSAKQTIVVFQDQLKYVLDCAHRAEAVIRVVDDAGAEIEEIRVAKMNVRQRNLLRIRSGVDVNINDVVRSAYNSAPFEYENDIVAPLGAAGSFCDSQVRAALRNHVSRLGERLSTLTKLPASELIRSIGEATAIASAHSGALIVRSPTGSGKTSKLFAPVAHEAAKRGQRPIYIAHLRSIISTAQLERLSHYERVNFGSEDDVEGLKICVNSITKSNWADVIGDSEVLLIDEAEQVLHHIFYGSVKNREAVYKQLIMMINQARLVILADAFASPLLLELLEKTNKAQTIRLLQLEADHSDIRVDMGDSDVVKAALFSDIEAGKKALVATDSRRHANQLDAKIRAQYKDKKVLLITSETGMGADQQAFYGNPNASNWDVIVFSPAMAASVSITERRFDVNYAFFGSRAILPDRAIQMIRRDRTAKKIKIGIKSAYRTDSFASDKILAMEKTFGKSDCEFERLAKLVQITADKLRSQFLPALVWLLRDQKFDLHPINKCEKNKAEGRRINKSAKRVYKEEHVRELLAAKPLSQKPRALANFTETTKDTSLAAERMRIEEIFGTAEVSRENIDLWEEGRLVGYLNNINHALMSEEKALAADQAEAAKKLALHDRRMLAKRRKLFTTVFKTLQIDLSTGKGTITHENAKKLLKKLNAVRHHWNIVSSVKVGKNWGVCIRPQTPVIQILRSDFGLTLKAVNERRGEKRERVRVIVEHRFAEIAALAQAKRNRDALR